MRRVNHAPVNDITRSQSVDKSLRLSLAEYNKEWLIQMKLGEPLKMSIYPLILYAT